MKNYQKETYNELAVIFKKILYTDGNIEYIPEKVVEGTYNEDNNIFIDKNGTPYNNIIECPNGYGYLYRDYIEDLKQKYPNLTLPLIKKLILKYTKKYYFIYCIAKKEEQKCPIILHKRKKIDEQPKLVLDKDILEFYMVNYPKFINEIQKEKTEDQESIQEEKTEITNALDIGKMYVELTSNVIDQDEPIRKILTAIWKQYNNFSDTKSRNILINGSTGVGKTQTFRILTKMLNVPHYMTSATEYTAEGYIGKSVTDMLVALIKNANYDIEKAQKGILIIDEIDKLSESNKGHSQPNQRDVQEALLKILEDGTFNLVIDNKDYTFNTSNLMTIGMGSWSRIELKEERPVGFEAKATKKQYKDITREDIIRNGMIPELIGRFPTIVQMNELNYDSFIKILKSENNILNINKKFLSTNGVTLTVEEDTLKEIAAKAVKQKYGARSLDEIIETALSAASFEIATNPKEYSELIITPETIKDNKKYTLVRKQTNKEGQ